MEKRIRKKPQEKRRLLAIDLKYIQLCQRRYFAGQEIQNLAVRGKQLLTWAVITCRNGDRKFMQTIRITSEPPNRIRK